MVTFSKKYNVEEESGVYEAKVILEIKNFTKEDEGQYKCASTNSLGKAETAVRLYSIQVTPTKLVVF